MEEQAAVCRRAESLLAGIYGTPIHLEVLEQFESSHTVLRCAVQHAVMEGALPTTLIVKQRALDQPRKPGDFDQDVLFRNEWASLEFLATLSAKHGPGPRRYASDLPSGMVVMEDLGTAQSVQDVLYGKDPQAALVALTGLGKTLGQIQGMTYGREKKFAALQKELGAAATLCDANRDCRQNMGEIKNCMQGLDLEFDKSFERAILELESEIHGLGGWRTFVHQDAGPHNFVVAQTGVQLLDFEFAGYGQGMLDIVCARLGFPPAFRGRVLPKAVVRQIEASFEGEFFKLAPKMAGDLDYPQALAKASAHWALSKLIGFYDYLEERLLKGAAYDARDGRDPQRSAFFRQQVFTYLRLALEGLEEGDFLPEFHQGLSQIVGRLLKIWPETPLLGTYPAFGGEAWRYP